MPQASRPHPLAALLVVDDNEMNRDMLSRRLERHGYAVDVATDGAEALDRIDGGGFDLVLLDVMMPNIDGLQVLARVRQRHSVADLPIIMTTARDRSEDIVQALELGANDYVTKPLDFPVVLARVQTQLALKRAKQELEAAHARMKRDLDAAARLQQALMPHALPAIDGIRFAWRFRPCDELAGDILDIVPLGHGAVGIYLLDVSGHGVPAALLSVTLSHVLSHTGEGSVLTQDDGARVSAVEPREVATRLNRRFPMDPATKQYFTFLYGVLDPHSREFRYVSAGHPGPVHLRRGDAAAFHDAHGFAIGWFADAGYDEHVIHLAEGDRVYLYSDGVTDARNAQGELFDRGRFGAILTDGLRLPLDASLERVMDELAAWCGERGQEDDVSLVAVEIQL